MGGGKLAVSRHSMGMTDRGRGGDGLDQAWERNRGKYKEGGVDPSSLAHRRDDLRQRAGVSARPRGATKQVPLTCGFQRHGGGGLRWVGGEVGRDSRVMRPGGGCGGADPKVVRGHTIINLHHCLVGQRACVTLLALRRLLGRRTKCNGQRRRPMTQWAKTTGMAKRPTAKSLTALGQKHSHRSS